MPKKRSFFQTICCCFCFDSTDPQPPQRQEQQRPQINQQQQQNQRNPQPVQQEQPQQKKEVDLAIKRDFDLSIGQISWKEERLNEEDVNKYKYCCPICLIYFNKILKTKCCNNYVCVECEYDIHQQMLNKKIEAKCWWCKSDKCEITDVQEGELIKNYSDAAQELEDNKKKELELIKSIIQESRVQRGCSMLKTFKSYQGEDKQNNMNPNMIKTIQSQYVDNLSNNLGTYNRNQWNDFNLNQQRLQERVNEEEDDDGEEENKIDIIGLGRQNDQPKFYKTDTFQQNKQDKKIIHQSLNSPNFASKSKNSSLCFNYNGQAVPLDQINNQNPLYNQYKNIDKQAIQNPSGYFFKENQPLPDNNQNKKYFNNQFLNQEEDPFAGGPNNSMSNNQPNKILEKNISSSDDDLNQRESDVQNHFYVPQNKKNEIINIKNNQNNIKDNNNNIQNNYSLSDINERE
ncbi:hypothetical protein TTHERM_00038810 (macronuclear) [Tetrahymena thermophila SB210]|uniref:Uncharacterized protein n=1 Tax=Tetrahymena thermophila (strain SB210) TaxID=312017 RepID=Q22M38_TETTS|nr:hypothetical protein TTHERM_00038810 [Tetrahymena thermophila SB210]EAR86466.1 hypothetical protein TTHERM_00038810 [Tetrahymena thermophila SB210]|eukprot:XP_977182.1 hypothetical protein TTHERM_00038810 [Tetrahymena thermophila SB210]